MGSAYIPNQNFFDNWTGYINTQGATLLLEINGVVYPNGFRVTYPGGYRNFYASRNSSGLVYVSCQAIAYGQDLPEYVLPAQGTRILIVGGYNQSLAAPTNASIVNTLTYMGSLAYYQTTISWTKVPNAITYSILKRQKNSAGEFYWWYAIGPYGVEARDIPNPTTGTTVTWTSDSVYTTTEAAQNNIDGQAIKIVAKSMDGQEGIPAYLYFQL